jgi:hypothetical protein
MLSVDEAGAFAFSQTLGHIRLFHTYVCPSSSVDTSSDSSQLDGPRLLVQESLFKTTVLT